MTIAKQIVGLLIAIWLGLSTMTDDALAETYREAKTRLEAEFAGATYVVVLFVDVHTREAIRAAYFLDDDRRSYAVVEQFNEARPLEVDSGRWRVRKFGSHNTYGVCHARWICVDYRQFKAQRKGPGDVFGLASGDISAVSDFFGR